MRLCLESLPPLPLNQVSACLILVISRFMKRSSDRLLSELGYDVSYARNFTDVDDKIIKRAMETGTQPLELSRKFSEEFQKDMVRFSQRLLTE